MKRILVKIAIIYAVFNVVLVGAFLSVGGLQMIRQPEIPVADSPASLQSDLKFFRDLVLANEADITSEQAEKFTSIIKNAPTPNTADDLTLITLRALAVFNNAHTTTMTTKMYRLPVRFHWTADGLIIVKTRPEFATLLGQRVLLLGGKKPEELLNNVDILIGGGTQGWRRYRSEFLFSAPSALSFLGAEVDSNSVTIHTLNPEGKDAIEKIGADSKLMPGDPFWDFSDAFPDDDSFNTAGWVTLLHRDQSLPLYLQDADKLHLLRDIPEYKPIYVRMNASFANETETLDQFEQRIKELISTNKPKNIVVDFRFNRGGDYTEVLPIVRLLANAISADGRLYLIVGPNTFSAGIIAASQFKRYVPDQLTIVGSEIGDKLRFRAEGFYPTLPESGIQLYLTKSWTDLIDGCGWLDDCWPPNKLFLRKVGSLNVDIPIENTWEAFRTGKDLVLNSVLNDIAKPNGIL